MEEGQRRMNAYDNINSYGLNPCCNGRGSKTGAVNNLLICLFSVLILVVMEEGQRLGKSTFNRRLIES